MDTHLVETPERVAGSPDPTAGNGSGSLEHDENKMEKEKENGQESSFNALGVIATFREEVRKALDDIRNDVARSHSPWMCANSAARYADCSTSTIFKAVTDGLLTRYNGLAGPRFKKEEIDRAIVTGKIIKKAKAEGRGKAPVPP